VPAIAAPRADGTQPSRAAHGARTPHKSRAGHSTHPGHTTRPSHASHSSRDRAHARAAARAAKAKARAAADAREAARIARMPDISEGAKGPLVRQLQRQLHIRVTGRFTASTRRAVMSVQRRHHLIADGIVGPLTRDALAGIKPIIVPVAPVAAVAAVASAGTSTTGASVSSTVASAASASAGSGGYSIPAGIVQCESGGNYSAVNPSSGAGGAYQILPSTWAAYGGQGLPQDASPAEQGAIAAKIYATQGPSAWVC
jgi:hypothetical protein